MTRGIVSTAVILIACCARAVAAEPEPQPSRDDVMDDCLAFVAATRSASAKPGNTCSTCPANVESKQVFKPIGIDITRISGAGNRCEANATIRVAFNPTTGQPITGGLVGWISPQQRDEWQHGKAPPGEQVYRVKVTYIRERNHWRAVEFEPDTKT